MKKTILSLALILSFNFAFSQNFTPELVPYPVTGFNKLQEDNPFILSQRAGANNTWSNMASYTWIPSGVEKYKKESTVSQFSNNTWELYRLDQNEFVVDNQNRITTAIWDQTVTWMGNTTRAKWKYQLTYNTQNKPTYMLVQASQTAPYTNFINSYNYSYRYNSQGQLISDSLYSYSDQQSYRRDYTYDANGSPASQTFFEYSSDDSTRRYDYTFVNGRLHAYTTTSLNQTTDIWETEASDTFDYDLNGNLIKRISYSIAFIDGQPVPLMPLTYETYGYNSLNKMDQMESKNWNNTLSAWVGSSRFTFNYDSDKPTIGYLYEWDITSQTYKTAPSVRYLFALPTALNETSTTAFSDLLVYPNPATKKVFISGSMSGSFQESAISLYNLSGQLNHAPVIDQNGVAEIDISHLSSGMYSIQIQSGETVIRKKLLIR